MDKTSFIPVYISIWLIVLFLILQIGIESQHLRFKDDLYGKDLGTSKNLKIAKKF